jgi:hypothetical protein
MPESKSHSLEWKHLTSPHKKFKTQLSAGSDDNFWKSHGPIMEYYQDTSTTVNSAHYSEKSGA